MELGIIGLGRMGGNMAERLRLGGHKVVGFDFSAEAVQAPERCRIEGRFLARGSGEEPLRAARHLDHGSAGQAGRRHHREAQAADAEGRHVHRRRQLELPGQPAPLSRAQARRLQLRRCGHLRRRLGTERGLQHDDRRRRRRRRAPLSHLRNPRARQRQRLGPRRPCRLRSLRQDGSQRHRVRHDAGLCRGLRDHGEEGRDGISTCRRSRRSGATAAWFAPGCSISPPMRSREIPN